MNVNLLAYDVRLWAVGGLALDMSKFKDTASSLLIEIRFKNSFFIHP